MSDRKTLGIKVDSDTAESLRDERIQQLRISGSQDIVEPSTVLCDILKIDTKKNVVTVEFDGDISNFMPMWLLQCLQDIDQYSNRYVIEIVREEDQIRGEIVGADE